MLDKLAKCGLVEHILQFASFKNNKELKKSDGAKRSRLAGVRCCCCCCLEDLIAKANHIQ